MATTKKKSTSSKKNSRSSGRRRSSATYERVNPPHRPARVRNEQDLMRDREIIGILAIAFGILLMISFALAASSTNEESGAVGIICYWIVRFFRMIGGSAAIAMPICLVLLGILMCADKGSPGKGRMIGLLLLFLAFTGLFQLNIELNSFGEYIKISAAGAGGGVMGALLNFALIKTIGRVGAIIIYVAFILIGLLLALQTSLPEICAVFHRAYVGLKNIVLREGSVKVNNNVQKTAERTPELPKLTAKARKHKETTVQDSTMLVTEPSVAPVKKPQPPKNKFVLEYMPDITDTGAKTADIAASSADTLFEIKEDKPSFEEKFEYKFEPVNNFTDDASYEEAYPEGELVDFAQLQKKAAATEEENEQQAQDACCKEDHNDDIEIKVDSDGVVVKPYVLPPVELIEPGLNVKNPRMNKTITDNIGTLESTLESFGVRATVTQVVAGPAVTRYELQPAPGVKVARITSLADDIALSLAAEGVRIEAPIPGKSAIGIEVARKETDTVFFREMIESADFRNSKAKLSVALGKNIGGECIIGDLAKMPHLLIAGSTGSGKSICVNTIICSLLYKATPDEVKLMLIDPKKVELTQYAQLPHLIAPVVSDSKKASNALKWIVNEMENRYSLFVGASCKDFEGYNRIRTDAPLPHIVVIIDELADLMMVAKHDVEDSICRIAQMARAAGIHLVVATQRPSVDVITGLIKANIPSRIAFAVSSYTDSRTIIDMGGAEKLLGKGDMLYHPIGNAKPVRVQGTFISEADVSRLVDYCCDQASQQFSEEAVQAASTAAKDAASGNRSEDGDELLYEAAMIIATTGQASVSFLQRRLAIGNPRAARLMDVLESKGVVGCSKGSKPRDILMSIDEIEELFGS